MVKRWVKMSLQAERCAPLEGISAAPLAEKLSEGEDIIAELDVGKFDLGGNEEPAPVEKEPEENLGFVVAMPIWHRKLSLVPRRQNHRRRRPSLLPPPSFAPNRPS